MSRSYKHHPFNKDRGIGKDAKQIASQRIRAIPAESEESEILASAPSNYRKLKGDTWGIHDYVSRYTREEAIKHYYELCQEIELNGRYSYYAKSIVEECPTVEDYLNKYWADSHRRK